MIQNTQVFESITKLKPMYVDISVCLTYAKREYFPSEFGLEDKFKANVTKLHNH